MRPLLASSALLFCSSAFAQITIGPTDMPSAGDTVRYRTTAAAGLDPTGTEAGYIWDFSMLTPDLEGADTCVTVGSTPLLYQLYFNNPFLYPQHQANYAVRGQGFAFQALTVSDVYEYFKKDATGFRNVGFGANVNGLPTSVRRLPIDVVHVFPLEYGDMDTSYSEFTLNVPSVFSFTQQQTRYNEVDGWGTLYLPADTFDVLRVKSTLARTDSAYIEQFGQGFTFPEPETIEYKWIAQGMDEPVLLITAVAGQVTTARFYYHPEDITTGLGAAYQEPGFTAYPNPATDQVRLSVPGDGGTLDLRDMQGRLVATERVARGVRQLSLDCAHLAAGTYTATFAGAGGVNTVRVAVQH